MISIKTAYFIGIGGIGMSAVARYLNHNGVTVSGYDRDDTPLIRELISEGITIYNEEQIGHVTGDIDMVIYTPAIPETHIELSYCRAHELPLYKRSEALKIILADQQVIAVAGTHGKTSTSAVLSHLLYDAGVSMTGFVGGIIKGYESNFLHTGNDWVVVEADEYDRSFLRLFPTIAVIQAMDADHLDIYGDRQSLIDSFRQFTLQIQSGGSLWVRDDIVDFWEDSTWIDELKQHDIKVWSFGYNQEGLDYGSRSMTCKRGVMSFTFGKDRTEGQITLPGLHNLYNTTAALAVSSSIGIADENLVKGLQSFSGIRRRYEIVHRSDELVFIDDYAHHPTEITAAINATRDNFPDSRLSVVFQPHLFSRTYDFHIEFAQALDRADQVTLLPIYPARELPVEGVTSALIYDLMTLEHKSMRSMSEWTESWKKQDYEVLLMLGAGDISKLIPKILNMLQ
jgi:UDP-N-acetylmuramate--alanine ligase